MKGKDYLNLNSYATAQNCYDAMVEMFEIDPSYSLRDGLKIAAVRYQMLLNGFGVSNSYTFAEDVSDVLVAKVKENSATFKGVDVEVVPYRHIVDGTLAAHIIGTVGKINAEEYAELKEKGYGMNDMVGKSGIEYSMEEYLRGTDGEKVVTVDPDGNVSETVTKEPVQGATVVLTIDADMQKLAQDTFAKWTENYAKSSKNKYGVPAAGALVVNDPNTGEILTILSYPTYDLNTYSEKYSELSKDERTPLWNRALRSTYAIGSTSKPSVAIAAIEEGLTNRDRVIRCTREFKYLDHTFYCNINHKDRNLTLRTALQDSCNIYFYTCGEELGVSRLNEYRSMLGLGVKTGVELTEAEGIEDSPEYRESIGQTWLPGYLILSSIGEGGTRFTPIQLANYVATIANGGTRYEQHLIKSVKSADYSETLVEKTPKVALETGISKYAIDCVTEGMEYVVNNNRIIQSALKGLDVQTAAKTGTSEENRKINGVSQVINNGLYITFAPSKTPRYPWRSSARAFTDRPPSRRSRSRYTNTTSTARRRQPRRRAKILFWGDQMAEKIVIASGKGGVGKSSLTAGLARALSGAGKRVLMLDMDIGLRSLDLIFGTQKDVLFDWGNVIDGGCEPNQAALAAGGPMLMTAPMRMSDSFTKESMKELADKLAKDYDYIFLTLRRGSPTDSSSPAPQRTGALSSPPPTRYACEAST